MAFNVSCFPFFLSHLFSCFSLLILTSYSRSIPRPWLPHGFPSSKSLFGFNNSGGKWEVLQKSVGVSAMHMQLLHDGTVVIFDRTDFGPSNLSLPVGSPCRHNDKAMPVDCTAHSVLYDVNSNSFRPLTVQTNVWCSSGAVLPEGTLIQTGGYNSGSNKIRLFSPCRDDNCDWAELQQNLTVNRWYASNHILPDGRVIVVGGRYTYSYEFFPKISTKGDLHYFPFLKETTDPVSFVENNLYPFLHLMPDGNLFVFANQRSVLLDYVRNSIVREFPAIPGEKRSYPSTGSSVLLPLRLTGGKDAVSPVVEVLICGGAEGDSYIKAQNHVFDPASKTCGRLNLTDPQSAWVMADMPMNRVMPDMLLLPTGDVIILNGASRGSAGWDSAIEPVINPVLYKPHETDPTRRFSVLNPATTPRMYHSSAILLPDGRILVGGSNPHEKYNFTGVKFPTDLSLDAFSPHYMARHYSHIRPTIRSLVGPAENVVSYGQKFSIKYSVKIHGLDGGLTVSMVSPSFTTHSFAMNQRLLMLDVVGTKRLSLFRYEVTVHAPASPNIAPAGYYMLFLVHAGIPGKSVWVKIK